MVGLEPRTYRRRLLTQDLARIRIVVGETDLSIAFTPMEQGPDSTLHPATFKDIAREAVVGARRAVQSEIALRPEFGTSLAPLPPRPGATGVVAAMYKAAEDAGVGPMAAVAGAIAEAVGRRLLENCPDVIVENGGDIFLCSRSARTIAVLAARSPLSGRIGLQVPAGQALGVCTSSATVGHSYSAGKADAAVIAADTAALADAMASAMGNRVHSPDDVQDAVRWALRVRGVRQALVIIGEALGVVGEFELVPL